VAEEAFDTTHRDFADPEGGPVWESFDEAVPQPVPTAPVSAGTAPDEHARVTWRDRNADDHGTAVAAIIGARTRLYADSPALTAPRLGMLTQSKEATALGFQIERALKDSPMTVINLSLNLKARLDTEKLRTVIEDAQSTALFVVAAPNSSQITLCARQEVWFPSCYGQLYRNVLVVGGTTLDGEHIHPTSPIGKDVHLFAPETGYFSAGRQNSYVPVEGTSFATALVSVAAAMLSSAGVTSPELIKQRLMATATVMEIPGRPQWARRLDIRRAVMFIGNSVMTDFGTGKERPVEVASRDDVLNFRTIIGNRALPVAVGDIRRLTRVEGNARGFELAYVVPGTNQLDFQAVQPPVTPWPFCYRPLNEKGQVSGERTCSDLAELKDYVGPIQ
jgi:subtilisin family serine protease